MRSWFPILVFLFRQTQNNLLAKNVFYFFLLDRNNKCVSFCRQLVWQLHKTHTFFLSFIISRSVLNLIEPSTISCGLAPVVFTISSVWVKSLILDSFATICTSFRL